MARSVTVEVVLLASLVCSTELGSYTLSVTEIFAADLKLLVTAIVARCQLLLLFFFFFVCVGRHSALLLLVGSMYGINP